MPDTDSPSGLRRLLRAELATADGVLPFARFMELALYAPGLGYYERGHAVVGRDGDFYTSVSVGPVFGELLAFRIARWLETARETTGNLRLVETGAHDGRLARDILGWLQRWRPALAARLRYEIVEPSETRRAWQAATLADFARVVEWKSVFDEGSYALSDPTVIFANELLDAFPVHRLGWDAGAKTWFEWGTKEVDGKFRWARVPADRCTVPETAWPKLPAELLSVLPDGFTTEACPAAAAWWRRAARTLTKGWLVIFDYGLSTEEFFAPHRANGTLRAFHRHRFADDLLALPGEQDLTAQVDFSALAAAGEAAGLTTVAVTTQRQWLTEVMAETLGPEAGFPAWDGPRTRQFQTLTHPEHLGRSFRVLVQRRVAAQ